MIISYKHNKIFPRIPKTGSTSLTDTITKIVGLGDQDISDPMSEKDFIARGLNTRNDYHPSCIGTNGSFHFTHATPLEMLTWGLLTDDNIATMPIYCFIRHPFSRFLSAYADLSFERDRSIFSTAKIQNYLLTPQPLPRKLGTVFNHPQKNWTHIDGQQVATLLFFENYEEEIRPILTSMGLPLDYPLPRTRNFKARESRMNAYDGETYDPNTQLTQECKDILSEVYADDLAMWTKLADEHNYMGNRWI